MRLSLPQIEADPRSVRPILAEAAATRKDAALGSGGLWPTRSLTAIERTGGSRRHSGGKAYELTLCGKAYKVTLDGKAYNRLASK
jgi:hypothetical protein